MLIVSDGDRVDDIIPSDPRIRHVHSEDEAHRKIGGKRNFANSLASGELIAHWDDDDWSAPARLATQVALLLDQRKPATGFRTMRFTDGDRSWLYEGDPFYAVGTSLLYRKDYWQANPFPHLQIGEDGAFVRNAIAGKQICVMDAGELMYATIHGGNTCPRNLQMTNYRPL